MESGPAPSRPDQINPPPGKARSALPWQSGSSSSRPSVHAVTKPAYGSRRPRDAAALPSRGWRQTRSGPGQPMCAQPVERCGRWPRAARATQQPCKASARGWPRARVGWPTCAPPAACDDDHAVRHAHGASPWRNATAHPTVGLISPSTPAKWAQALAAGSASQRPQACARRERHAVTPAHRISSICASRSLRNERSPPPAHSISPMLVACPQLAPPPVLRARAKNKSVPSAP